jgi:hypothetical protein
MLKLLLAVKALAYRVKAEHAGDFFSSSCLLVQEAWILKAPHLLRSSLNLQRTCDINILAFPHAL